MSPRPPGRRRDCPEWCVVNHAEPLDPVHRGVAAEIHRGEHQTVIIIIESDPRVSAPLVGITAWDLAKDTSAALELPPADVSELAVIVAVLGLDDIAGYLRGAVDLLERPEP